MFKLLRYFSLASFVALAAALAAALWINRETALAHISRGGEDGNVALARAFANSVWPLFGPYFKDVAEFDGARIRARAETRELNAEIRALSRDLPVLKVKIYSLAGNTLFSTEALQIGERKTNHPAIARAREGKVTSELIERGKFSAMDGERANVHLLSSYVPVAGRDGTVAGVFEIYSDVTALMRQLRQAQILLGAQLFGVFGALYLALYFIVRHGDRVIHGQYEALERSHETARRQAAALEREQAERRRAQSEVTELLDARGARHGLRDTIASLGAELRAPIDAIIGYARAMREKTFGPDAAARYAGFAADIERTATALRAMLLDGILAPAGVGADGAAPQEPAVDLRALAADCVRMAAVHAEEVGVAIAHDLQPATLAGDARMLRQVLLNLLSNAIKFTPRDGRVWVRLGPAADGGVMLEVSDAGPGIAPDAVAQLASPGAGELSLTGPGLPVVKSLVERHRGTMRIDSEPGKGTRAVCTFPACPAPRQDAVQAA